MSADWVSAIASVATFGVIVATAIAALAQLRHLRNSNQIAVFTELRHQMETPEFESTLAFIRNDLPEKLNDPAYRKLLLDRNSPESQRLTSVGRFLDVAVAPLVKHRFVDRDLACDLFFYPVVPCWDTLAPLIATYRAERSYRLWEDFEYLAMLCKDFRRRFPEGTYPRNAPALELPAPWPELASGERSSKING